MALPTQTLFAVDPRTQKVRLVVQVTPEGWEHGGELEDVLSEMIPVLNHAGIRAALLVSLDTTFLIRRDERSPQFEIDELSTSEAFSPLPVPADASALVGLVESWVGKVASDWRQFVPESSLPRRVPEIVPLVVGAEIRWREGAIGLPESGYDRVSD